MALLNVLVVNAGSTSLKLSLVDEHGSAKAVASLEDAPGDVDAVGHRIVHMGDLAIDAARVDDGLLADIEAGAEIAPLHNGPRSRRSSAPVRRCRDSRTSPSPTRRSTAR